MDKRYNIILNGIGRSFEPRQVIQNVATLFKCSEEEAQRILEKPGSIIKEDITRERAEKYKSAIERTGALCIFEAIASEEEALDFSLPLASPAPRESSSEPTLALIPPEIKKEKENHSLSFDEAFKVFIGPNHRYFLNQWKAAERRGDKNSWNWAAFFVSLFTGVGWLAYRKMYLLALIVLCVSSISSFFIGFFMSIEFLMFNVLSIGCSIVLGWYGNGWYQKHVERNISKMMSIETTEDVGLELARFGGTSLSAAFVFVFFMFIIFIQVLRSHGYFIIISIA